MQGQSLAAAETKADIAARYETLETAYHAQLEELAAWADENHWTDAAEVSRRWLPATMPEQLHFACRPAPGDATDLPASAQAEWRERFAKLRTAQATALFELATAAVDSGHASAAWPLLVAVIREDPDHAAARKILGYEAHDGEWLTQFEIGKARDGQVWHPRFGWLPAGHVERYEKGERFYNNRWMKSADEQRLRTAARKGWDVVTEHYQIHTTHSLEEGVRLATRLERLHDVWQQMFAGFGATEAQLARRFAGQAALPAESRRYKVVYFRNRDEYVKSLERAQPNIDISTGYYLAEKRVAYFYADETPNDGNLYHEATHQLFSEIRRSVHDVGQDANYWIVEGIACYMESLVETDGWHLLGGAATPRLQNAIYRFGEDDFYIPLVEFTALGRDQWQRDPSISKLYSQASGVTYFLLNNAQGRYREPLVSYLAAIYQGRDGPATLSEMCGASYTELDTQYRQYIERFK